MELDRKSRKQALKNGKLLSKHVKVAHFQVTTVTLYRYDHQMPRFQFLSLKIQFMTTTS